MIEKLNGASIFVSHSSKDWIKVREIRNYLEEKGHYPLLFHLKCLEDEDEINDLLKREIQARNWFVLCDSENARDSRYVSNEIEYIKSLKDKVFEIIDLKKEVNAQLDKLDRLSKRATIFLSCSSKDQEISKNISEILRANDYQVFNVSEDLSPGLNMQSQVQKEIENSIKNGFFLPIITKNSLKSLFVQEDINYALELSSKFSTGGNIIPISFVKLDKLFEALAFELVHSIRHINIADFSEGTLEENLNTLIEQLKFQEME